MASKALRKLRDHHPAGSPEFDSEAGKASCVLFLSSDRPNGDGHREDRRRGTEPTAGQRAAEAAICFEIERETLRRVRKARGDAPIETAQVDLESRWG